MRVSHNMMYNMTLQNIFHNQRKLLELDEQATTGKRIIDTSDDPLGFTKVLSYRESLSSLGQYPRNMNKANAWLSAADSVLQDISSNIRGAKTLALAQANGSMSAESRKTAIEEVEGIIRGIIQAGNTQVGGEYIFAGSYSHIRAFNDDGTYNGNNRYLSTEIGPGTHEAYNTPGSQFLVTDLIPTWPFRQVQPDFWTRLHKVTQQVPEPIRN